MAEDAKMTPHAAERPDRAEWEKPVLSRLDTKDAEAAGGSGGDNGAFS